MQNYQTEYIKQFNAAFGSPVELKPNKKYFENADQKAWEKLNKVIGIIDAVFGFKGTCSFVHAMPCLIEKICFIFDVKRAFVTYGGVWDVVRNAEVFGGAGKEEYIKKNLREDGTLDSNCGNYHTWITLDSGEIIDFTLASTLFGIDPNAGVRVINGPAFLGNRFQYRPYAVGYYFPKVDALEKDVKVIQTILNSDGWEQCMRQMLIPYLQSIKDNDNIDWNKIQSYFQSKNTHLHIYELGISIRD